MKSILTKSKIISLILLFVILSNPSYGQDKKAKLNLKDYTGKYAGPNNFLIVFTLEGSNLYGEPNGTQKSELNHVDGDKFLVVSANKELEFLRDKSGIVDRVQFNFFGEDITAIKVKLNLNDFAGTYTDKDKFSIVFTVEGGKLFGEPAGTPKSELIHSEGDKFLVVSANKTVEFLRDKNGKIEKVQFNFFNKDIVAEKKLK